MTRQLTQLDDGLARAGASALVISELAPQDLGLSRHLTELGWSVTVAGTAQRVRECLDAQPFDLAILDIEVGYRTIQTVIGELRERSPEMRLAILLGWWDNRAWDMRQWSDLFIYNPVHPEQLRQAMRRLADGTLPE